MAMRQQNQIEAQQQMLVAKEQRLKYLRQQDFKQNQMAAEYERLRRLREKVRGDTHENKIPFRFATYNLFCNVFFIFRGRSQTT